MGRGSIYLLIAAVSGLIWLAFVLYFSLPDRTVAKDLLQIIQAAAASVAIAMGGFFAIVKLQLFRDFAPHVTITQIVSHRIISDSYVHLLVTATLQNSSKVRVNFQEGYFRLQIISPVADVDVEALYAEVFEQDKYRNFQWKTGDAAHRAWSKDELIIEPGESHQEICEFIVSSEVLSVLIDTYFFNVRQPAVPQGWGVTTAHDILSYGQ